MDQSRIITRMPTQHLEVDTPALPLKSTGRVSAGEGKIERMRGVGIPVHRRIHREIPRRIAGTAPAGILDVDFVRYIRPDSRRRVREQAQDDILIELIQRTDHPELIGAKPQAFAVDDLGAIPLAIYVSNLQVQIAVCVHIGVTIAPVVWPGTKTGPRFDIPGIAGPVERGRGFSRSSQAVPDDA